MADIKSAWEIAQEKASKLGKLSPEEREVQRLDRCRLTGESIADKYLSHYDISIIRNELNKHDVQDRDLISKAAVRALIKRIDLRHPPVLIEIRQGIIALENNARVIKTLDGIKELFQEYAETENKERQEIETAGREMLHQLRISGTAVNEINIRAKEEWQKKLDQMANPFYKRLNFLKQELQIL